MLLRNWRAVALVVAVASYAGFIFIAYQQGGNAREAAIEAENLDAERQAREIENEDPSDNDLRRMFDGMRNE